MAAPGARAVVLLGLPLILAGLSTCGDATKNVALGTVGAAHPFGALDTVFHLLRHCPPRLHRRQSNHFRHEPNGFKCSNRKNPTAMSF